MITNCPIILNYCNLSKQLNQLVEKDFEYEIKQKDKKIEKYKRMIIEMKKKYSPPKKPEDYEPNIFKACVEGKLSSVQWLIEGEKIDKNQKVEKNDGLLGIHKGEAPIHIAIANGHLSIVRYLIEKQGVDIELIGIYNKTPLLYACENNQLQIVEYLISKGANIEARDQKQGTPLHYACINNCYPLVEYLISKSAPIEAKDNEIKTSLHYACERDFLQIVTFLISKNANIEAKDKQYWTPLHYASYCGQTNIVKYLVSKGANKTARDNNNLRPYDLACKGWGADDSQINEIRNLLK